MLKTAYEIAKQAHAGQVDKAGQDYIGHPVFVAGLLKTEEERAAALLHDVLEDSSFSEQDLRLKGIPEPVIQAVILLTKQKGVPYEDYLSKIKENPIARAVKKADLTHNMDISRIPHPLQKDFDRLEKYKKAFQYLS